ncbi:MAG: hypothetical protein M1818_003903 [Claussenomyces sp. TS43310]|nr:MAG: hypothetical protein M1818_003903 [Claussenomyces sp. TS43310]
MEEKSCIDTVHGPPSHGEGRIMSAPDEDIAAAYANQLDGEGAYSRKEEVRLRWKLDLRLVPILWFNVTLGAMDKVTTATAALYGMKKDTDLTGNRYSWVGSAFYFGYLFWCLPAASILQKLPVAKTMCAVQLLWGIVLIGTGFAHNFETLIALRVLLGVLEAPIIPGNFLVLGMWCVDDLKHFLDRQLTHSGIRDANNLSAPGSCIPASPSALQVLSDMGE